MGMLMRILKRRLKEGGFSCIATSATITSLENDDGRAEAAAFARAVRRGFRAGIGDIRGECRGGWRSGRKAASCLRAPDERTDCKCGADIAVVECETHKDEQDHMKVCAVCEYAAQGYGDLVREIVHRTDGPGRVLPPRCHRFCLKASVRVSILRIIDRRRRTSWCSLITLIGIL